MYHLYVSTHLFLSLIFTLSLTSAHAQLAIISEAVAELIENARRAASEENYSAAIEQLRMAEVAPNITQKENAFVQQSILAYMVRGQNYAGALEQVKTMIADGVGNRSQNIHTCLRLSGAAEGECFSTIPDPVDATEPVE